MNVFWGGTALALGAWANSISDFPVTNLVSGLFKYYPVEVQRWNMYQVYLDEPARCFLEVPTSYQLRVIVSFFRKSWRVVDRRLDWWLGIFLTANRLKKELVFESQFAELTLSLSSQMLPPVVVLTIHGRFGLQRWGFFQTLGVAVMFLVLIRRVHVIRDCLWWIIRISREGDPDASSLVCEGSVMIFIWRSITWILLINWHGRSSSRTGGAEGIFPTAFGDIADDKTFEISLSSRLAASLACRAWEWNSWIRKLPGNFVVRGAVTALMYIAGIPVSSSLNWTTLECQQ